MPIFSNDLKFHECLREGFLFFPIVFRDRVSAHGLGTVVLASVLTRSLTT